MGFDTTATPSLLRNDVLGRHPVVGMVPSPGDYHPAISNKA
jgi:hypothetical protein